MSAFDSDPTFKSFMRIWWAYAFLSFLSVVAICIVVAHFIVKFW